MTPAPASRVAVVTVFAAVLFVALCIAGLGMVTLATGEEVVARPGMGAFPGVGAMALSVLAWALVVVPALRGRRGVGAAVLAGAAGTVGYLAGILLVGLTRVPPVEALAVTGRVVTMGFVVVVFVAGVLAATGAAVAVRSDGAAPTWPWERGED